MTIEFIESEQIFHLQTPKTSYVIGLVRSLYPAHIYWGRKLRSEHVSSILQFSGRSSFSPEPFPDERNVSFDSFPQEYPGYGTGDFRHPAYQVQLANGTTAVELQYRSHKIYPGKPALEGLPATYVEQEREAETLELELIDPAAGIQAVLCYTVFNQQDAITRSVRLTNVSDEDIQVQRALSASVDFPHSDYDLLQLSGAWARERHVVRRHLVPGMQGIESRRGSSGHQQNPFIALLSPEANESYGDVYGFSFVYSGSFEAQVEVEQYGTTRVSMGLNPFDFSWLLTAGESFQTPETVLVYSAEGLGGMSRTYHRLYRTRLCRGEFRDKNRPVLVNNWEATYFDFNAEKIEQIAKTGKELGIELFVLDDGWFGKRNSDNSSLGDWYVDKNKLPNGLKDLGERIEGQDMQFGLWFEPEMVSPDSELYRAHPDWCLHVPKHRRTEARNQLVLDFSRADVCDAVAEMMSDVLRSAPISYVKWDMNRNMTEIGSAKLPPERQRETAHRYMLGLYRVLEHMTSSFPHILFESCSGGGGRFDPGMLYYMPQTWTSDNTDAISRLKIQYGTSLVYPISSMGAHVSAVPNHQVHRFTSLEMRAHVAMSGNFGYELDLSKFSDEEKALVKTHIEQYKANRSLVQFGDQYRLLSPFEGNEAAWMVVSTDKSEAVLFFFRVLAQPNAPLQRLRLQGLDPEANYRLEGGDSIFGGDQLMYAGIPIADLNGDYVSQMWKLMRVDS